MITQNDALGALRVTVWSARNVADSMGMSESDPGGALTMLDSPDTVSARRF